MSLTLSDHHMSRLRAAVVGVLAALAALMAGGCNALVGIDHHALIAQSEGGPDGASPNGTPLDASPDTGADLGGGGGGGGADLGGGGRGTLCNATTCPAGCCGTDGQCHTDQSSTVCGTAAAACQVCTSTQACTAGRCADKCNSGNCPNGCCDATGTCVTTLTDGQCGTNGAVCGACTGSNRCVLGQCGCASSLDCPSYQACEANHACSNMCSDAITCNGGCCSAANQCANTANYGKSCGSCGGTVQCDGSCSVNTPLKYGTSCACGGTIQCDGSCSANIPSNYGKGCGSCGGVTQCDNSCSVSTPASFGKSCGSCGGVTQCDGSCSVNTPANFGKSCSHCGGTTQCDGSCSVVPIVGNARCATITAFGQPPSTPIVPGSAYGKYIVQSVSLDPNIPLGYYQFYISNPTAGGMALESGGRALPSATYNWQTTVCNACSPPQTATLNFPGYMSVTVTSNGGSLNLYDLNTSFADDAHYIGACCL
jgi:hypothetical protein